MNHIFFVAKIKEPQSIVMFFSSSKKVKMESLGFPHKGGLQLVVAMAVADQWFSS